MSYKSTTPEPGLERCFPITIFPKDRLSYYRHDCQQMIYMYHMRNNILIQWIRLILQHNQPHYILVSYKLHDHYIK